MLGDSRRVSHNEIMTVTTLLKLFLLIISLNIFSLGLSYFFPLLDFHFLMVTLLGFAVWFAIDRPFEVARKPSIYDTITASTFVLFFFLHVAWVILSPILIEQEKSEGPCQKNSIEKTCYTFTLANCETVWNRYELDCKNEVRKTIYEKNPSALIGPAIDKCIYKKIDKAFQSTRRITTEPLCLEHFESLKN